MENSYFYNFILGILKLHHNLASYHTTYQLSTSAESEVELS